MFIGSAYSVGIILPSLFLAIRAPSRYYHSTIFLPNYLTLNIRTKMLFFL